MEQLTVCIPWQGYIDRHGYGHVGRHELAHRAAYEAAKGPIPPGLTIDHLCRNRRCVNPQHLEAVTVAENTRRGRGAAFQRRTARACKNGHPFDEANTYQRNGSGGGFRGCRACNRDAVRRYKARQRVAA